MNKKSIIKLIILIIISILFTGTCVIFIIAGNKIHNDDYIVFSVIALMFILPFLIWEIIKILKSKKTPNNINEDILKQQIVDVAFNTFLREGQDYTIKARTEGAILVKKIARWAYFDASTNDIQACFSIETDKGIYCFQQKGNELSLIPTDISSSIYPELLPSTPKQVSIEEIFGIIDSNEEITIKEKRKEEFELKKAKETYPFLPADYLSFISKYSYIEHKNIQIGSFLWNENNLTGAERMQTYLDSYNKQYKVEDWFFIGSDGMGGEYAFSTQKNDGMVYYFDHENPNILFTYATFTEFMFEMISK